MDDREALDRLRNIYDPFCGHLPFDRVLEPLEMVLGHEEDLVPTYIVV